MILRDIATAAEAVDPGHARPKLFINGKFYSGATNGVHRVADRLLRELDRLACEGGAPSRWDMRLLVPTVKNWAPAFAAVRVVPQSYGHSQFWEQALLPLRARGGMLANFANLAPAWHPNQLTMVHDAQFRISPNSYPPKLRWGYRALIPRGAKASQLVLTVSDYARDSLATFGIREQQAIRVLPNGGDHILETAADDSIRLANGLRHGEYALMFGSVAAYKNVAVVFDAFARPELAALTLVMVGPSRQGLLDAGLRPPPGALFVGSVDDAGLRSLYEGARCLLYPSRTEGFGLPPVEAMLCGARSSRRRAAPMPGCGVFRYTMPAPFRRCAVMRSSMPGWTIPRSGRGRCNRSRPPILLRRRSLRGGHVPRISHGPRPVSG
jgi:glycosyltransferase involved in cell wall biosynthesis